MGTVGLVSGSSKKQTIAKATERAAQANARGCRVRLRIAVGVLGPAALVCGLAACGTTSAAGSSATAVSTPPDTATTAADLPSPPPLTIDVSSDPPVILAPLPIPPATQAVATTTQTACAAFQTFYADLLRLTPHAQIALVTDAQAIQAPFRDAPAPLSAADSALSSDVDDLLADVGSSAFPTQGNIYDPQITKVQQDCS